MARTAMRTNLDASGLVGDLLGQDQVSGGLNLDFLVLRHAGGFRLVVSWEGVVGAGAGRSRKSALQKFESRGALEKR